ncbi:MAG TPA: FHA domain-containing protein [Pirellulales bacterium]|nr:FHA domain-containing protein [Pirellulales bacterium]
MAQPWPRFLIWIDSVGGFLVCPGDEIKFGQAVPGNPVDVPLVADLSRHQLTIRRDAEGYVAEPLRDVALNGQPLRSPASLTSGDRLALGPVELVFRRPHPLSATARLDLADSRRVRPACDAVLLLADACVLGPKPASHVVCADWPAAVVLVRDEAGGLICQTAGHFEIDGRAVDARAALGYDSRVSGKGFSFSLEQLR